MTLPRHLRARATWYSRIGLGHLRRAVRSAIAGVGLPIRKEFLVIDCADGAEASGLFSEVAAVLGCLDETTAHRALYAGMRVDFQDHGLYHDPASGPNWWEYFFEPLAIGSPAGATIRAAADWEHDAFAETVELAMSRHRAAELLRQYVRVRPALLDQVARYWTAHTGGAYVVGVHYRGTDKWEGAPIVPYDAVAQAVVDAAPAGTAWKLFLATDEEACVDFMRQRFHSRVITLDIRRSSDGRPLHKATGNGYRKGEAAMIDCLLLARCSHLVRTDSDLGLFSTFFNPDLPVTMLGKPT